MHGIDSRRYFNSSKNWWKYDPKWIVLHEITGAESVLDVGCSYGDFGVKLKEKGCVVDGIEIYEPAYNSSKLVLDKVYKINLDYPEAVISEIKQTYSVVTFMDVLEHCKDPEVVLLACKTKLKDDGRIFFSLPNVLNIKERFLFFFGIFDYKEYGVLDRTHLRFYTKKTALGLMLTAFPKVRIVGYTPRYNFLKKIVRLWPEMFALQFVIEGRN